MLSKKGIGKVKTVSKGIYFNHHPGNLQPEIVKTSLPGIVIIPLKQGFGCENPSFVKKGDKVKAGQIIGRDDESICSPIHSSVSGKVIDIVEIKYIHEDVKESLEEKVKAVKIKTAGEKLEKPLEEAGSGWKNKDPVKIRELLYLAGVSSQSQTGIPTEFKSSPFSPEDVKNIIINAIYTEPFVYSTVRFPEEVERYKIGLNIISHAFPQAKVHAALSEYLLKQFKTSSNLRKKIRIYSVKNKHPQSFPEVLIHNLLGDKLSYGTFPMDKGVLILPGDLPLSIYQAVVEGKPYIRKRISIGGGGIKKEGVVDVPIGISLKEVVELFLIREVKPRIIIGGPLTGSYQEDLSLPLGKEIDSIVVLEERTQREFLSFLRPGLKRLSYSRAFLSSLRPKKEKEADADVHGEKRPCVYCSFCQQVCPTDILPYQIYQCYTHELIDEVERLTPLECIGCGLCSYVCPSKLPLSETLKMCKSKLSQKSDFVIYGKKKGRVIVDESFFAEVCEGENGYKMKR